ncbi:MAG: response regulator [Candidatus Cloacimonetes bacterium]|nr:response regulator [Candidatus Cloacimonadota bacterium]
MNWLAVVISVFLLLTSIKFRQNEERFQALAAQGRVIIWEMDPKGVYTYVTDSCEPVLGYTVSELVGKLSFVDLHPEETREDFAKLAFDVFSQKKSFADVLNPAVRKDGRIVWFSTNGSPILSANGELLGYRGTDTDITEKKQAEDALIRLNKELEITTALAQELARKAEAANLIKGEFLANMSHEIRTPLNAVIGMNSLMLETSLDEDQKEMLLTGQNSAKLLLNLINDILDFSKIEAGKLALVLDEFDLFDFLSELRSVFSAQALEKGLGLEFECHETVPTVIKADPIRLRQVLYNLISNAIKFTHQGSVAIKVETVSQTLCFRVLDSGIGISEEMQDRLFERFSQVDSSSTRKYGGTGLGLAIVKQLVQLMGGQVGVLSKLNSGSEFWFTIPLVSESVPPRVQKEVDPTVLPIKAGKKILVVDDNPVNQRVAEAMLFQMKLQCDCVSNGLEAVEALKISSYDLVLMDVQMAIMDGIEATRTIRDPSSDVLNKSIPIIAMTAHAMHGDREKCLQAGMDGYITKPIDPLELKKIMTEFLADA